METKQLTLGSLFDGSGGFPLAGILSGIKPVWNSEIEPFAIRVTEKRLPDVKHYGDVSKLHGDTLEPVDIITFGSPCQDMSIAGKRSGLEGSRSGLFFDAIRIIKEMREATDGKYPRYAVWENVPGAFSSNGGDDFRAVLKEFCSIRYEETDIPEPEKWSHAGLIMGEGFSLGWRLLDAQYWGVPQRRKRIYLVTDFDGERAGSILFESEGLSGYSAESFKAWQRTANDPEESTGEAGSSVNPLMFENHPQDSRCTGPLEESPTLNARYGTGGNNQPLVLNQPKAYGISPDSSHAMLSDNPHAGIYEAKTSRTLDGNGGSPACNQGGIAIVEQQTFDVRFSSEGTKNQRGHCYETHTSRCLDTGGEDPDSNHGGIAVISKPASYSAGKGSFFMNPQEEKAESLMASDYKDPPLVNDGEYIVRRLTPIECARLQGFPDWWCSDLADEDPSDEEIEKWKCYFEEFRLAAGKSKKPKTRNQIIKWLKSPYTDNAAYRLWGNGIALPCAWFVLAGIVWADCH